MPARAPHGLLLLEDFPGGGAGHGRSYVTTRKKEGSTRTFHRKLEIAPPQKKNTAAPNSEKERAGVVGFSFKRVVPPTAEGRRARAWFVVGDEGEKGSPLVSTRPWLRCVAAEGLALENISKRRPSSRKLDSNKQQSKKKKSPSDRRLSPRPGLPSMLARAPSKQKGAYLRVLPLYLRQERRDLLNLADASVPVEEQLAPVRRHRGGDAGAFLFGEEGLIRFFRCLWLFFSEKNQRSNAVRPPFTAGLSCIEAETAVGFPRTPTASGCSEGWGKCRRGVGRDRRRRAAPEGRMRRRGHGFRC